MCAFMEQFNKVSLNIINLNPVAANLDKLRQCVAKFMHLEELREFTNKVKEKMMLSEDKPVDQDGRVKFLTSKESLSWHGFHIILVSMSQDHMCYIRIIGESHAAS